MADTGPVVVLVGHCGPDGAMLRRVVERAIPGAQVRAAYADEELQSHIAGASLLLVNRALDGAFMAPDGVSLIAGIVRAGPSPACMLISNYADAQASAEAAGARPGFGKSEAYTPLAVERLRAAMDALPGSRP